MHFYRYSAARIKVSFLYKLEKQIATQANIWAAINLKEPRQLNTATYNK